MIVCICSNINEERARKILKGLDAEYKGQKPYAMDTTCAKCSQEWHRVLTETLNLNPYNVRVP